MKQALSLPRLLGALGSLLLFCAQAKSAPIQPPLPAEVAMNNAAGRGGKLSVKVRLGNGQELPFIVDTGTTLTLLDKSLQSQLGPQVGTANFRTLHGIVKNNLYTSPALYLGNTRLLTDDKIATSHIGRPRGTLGMDCLKHYCIQLDFAAGKMRFLDPDHLNATNLGKAFPIVIRHGCPFIQHESLTAKGTNLEARIDTAFPIDGRVKVDDGTLREDPSGLTHLRQCVWDGQTYTNLLVEAAGDGANLLGLRFLARHLVTFNFPKGIVYLKQTSVGPLRDEKEQASPEGLPPAKAGAP